MDAGSLRRGNTIVMAPSNGVSVYSKRGTMWPPSTAQKILLVIAAAILLLLEFAWVFSDASVGNTLEGLLLNLALVGVPTLLLYLLLAAIQRRQATH